MTTGGTGFAPRDQTPEGTRQVIEREAPGLAEAMRADQPVRPAVPRRRRRRGQAIVCNTPGSPKGCVEQLGAILDVLPHALGPPPGATDVALTVPSFTTARCEAISKDRTGR